MRRCIFDSVSSLWRKGEYYLQEENRWLMSALESLLICSGEPVSVADAAKATEHEEGEVEQAFVELAKEYKSQSRGFVLRHSVRGWHFASDARFDAVLARFDGRDKQRVLSQAAMEVLSIIAYRQPVSRSEVSTIRGVLSDSLVRTLLVQGYIAEKGQDEQTHARLLVTTDLLLERLGLASLDDLPELAPLLPDSAQEVE